MATAPEVRDVPPISVEPGETALSTISKAEIDVQIATAKRFPRSIKAFRVQAEEMATLDDETAASMFYSLPRDGKTIEGPSVRLAEVVGSAWGNLRYGSRIVEIGDKFVTAQGVCFDLEKNVSAQVEVQRRIVGRDGRRYSPDMIGTTCNAAMSIALRNAVFKVVPFSYVSQIYQRARLVAIGEQLTMEQRRTKAFDWFAKLGVRPERVLALLQRKGLEDVTLEDLITLTGLRTAIKDGDTSIEEAFAVASPVAVDGAKSRLDNLAATLEAQKAQKAAEGPQAPAMDDVPAVPVSGDRPAPDEAEPLGNVRTVPVSQEPGAAEAAAALTDAPPLLTPPPPHIDTGKKRGGR